MKEQFVPAEHRDIASFNADNEFNRATDEENIDFNIPGLPHSAVKQLHGASVRDLIQKIENHPHRHALQRDASSNANKFNLAIDEENIDFNISSVPNAMVKRSHGVNVHNLIQRIENHPQRQALQSDLQQHRAFNPFSKESRDVIKAAGNTELCEIVDVEPKAQCRACLAYWDVGIVYCTCGHFLRDDTK